LEENKESEKAAFMIASVNVREPDKMGPYMETKKLREGIVETNFTVAIEQTG
jgi:hypothetical protein